MGFKGTAGPWEPLTETELELPSGIIKSGKKSIAHTLQKEVGADQAKANAYLIAAAPDLLEALIEIRKLVAFHDKADVAIAKALGEMK